MNGKILSVIFMTALMLSLAACGGTKQSEPVQTKLPTETPQPTEVVVTEVPTAKPTPIPAPISSYTWKKYSYIETTNDGYKIEKYYSFIDKWISSSDEAQIKKICSELHIENMPSVQNIGIKVNEAEPQFYYVFGKVTCANITEGWDINDGNSKSVYYNVGLKRQDNKDDYRLRSTVLRGFYSSEISQAHNNGGFFYNDKNHSKPLGIDLKKNKSGTLPFVIAVYSQKNPNYPNGDDWYKELEVTVTDKSNYVGGHYEPDFKFVPSV